MEASRAFDVGASPVIPKRARSSVWSEQEAFNLCVPGPNPVELVRAHNSIWLECQALNLEVRGSNPCALIGAWCNGSTLSRYGNCGSSILLVPKGSMVYQTAYQVSTLKRRVRLLLFPNAELTDWLGGWLQPSLCRFDSYTLLPL